MCSKKTEDLNLHVFNMITRINKSKLFTQQIPCKCECKFDSREYSSNQKWNDNKCWSKCKNPKKHHSYKTTIFGILLHVVARLGEYVERVIDNSVIMFDEII